MPPRGLLFLFEGLDRSGKSTQSQLLATAIDAQLLKFPDRTTAIGQLIADVLTKKTQMNAHALHLLFVANRWELQQTILQTLEKGKHIVMDRYSYSGIAYAQPEINPQWAKYLEHGLPEPDCVFYMNIDAEAAKRRKGWGMEKFEVEDAQNRAREGFKQFESLKQWGIINADREVDSIHKEIMGLVNERILTARTPLKDQKTLPDI